MFLFLINFLYCTDGILKLQQLERDFDKAYSVPPSIEVQQTASRIKHLAIIPDGSRRWAKLHGLELNDGYMCWVPVLYNFVKYSFDLGIHTISIAVTSVENIDKRNPDEIEHLYFYFKIFLEKILENENSRSIRIIHLGNKQRLSDNFKDFIQTLERKTESNTDRIVNILIDYGGRNEVLTACKEILLSGLRPDDITKEKFEKFLDTGKLKYPDPDLIIRTAPRDELHLSGFMPWQSVYSELCFVKKCFLDFDRKTLDQVILEFGKRERNFGGKKYSPILSSHL